MNEHFSNNPMLLAARQIERVLAGELMPETALDAWPDFGRGGSALLIRQIGGIVFTQPV
jgi:hypothetical protein